MTKDLRAAAEEVIASVDRHISDFYGYMPDPVSDALDALRTALAQPPSAEVMRLEAENAGLREWIFDRLNEIHNLAHIKSSGPAEIDGYWEIRSLAEDALKDTP